MKGKLALVMGGAIGYVLGTRAGRERYEQIKSQAKTVMANPKVRETAAHAQDYAKEKGPEVGHKVADKVSEKVSGRSSAGGTSTPDTGLRDTLPSETYPNADTPPGGLGSSPTG
jgi:hypothetical protein